MPYSLQCLFSGHYESERLQEDFSTPHGSPQRQNLGFASPQIPSFSRLSVEARCPGWVRATAQALLTPELELQQGCEGLSYSNPSAAHPLASPTALLLSIMWEPQGGSAAQLLPLWQVSRESAAQGSPEPVGPECSHRSWDLPHPQQISLIFGTGIRICPTSSYHCWGSWGASMRAKQPKSHPRFVLSHGRASENPICCSEQPFV